MRVCGEIERGGWEKIIVSKRGECLIGKGNGDMRRRVESKSWEGRQTEGDMNDLVVANKTVQSTVAWTCGHVTLLHPSWAWCDLGWCYNMCLKLYIDRIADIDYSMIYCLCTTPIH